MGEGEVESEVKSDVKSESERESERERDGERERGGTSKGSPGADASRTPDLWAGRLPRGLQRAGASESCALQGSVEGRTGTLTSMLTP